VRDMTAFGKILFVITRAEIGGAQAHVWQLIEQLSRTNPIALATGTHGWLTECASAAGIERHVIPSLVRSVSPRSDFIAAHALTALIKSCAPEIVHLHSSKAGIIGRIAAARANRPAVFTAHGWGFTPGAPLVRRLVALTAERLASRLKAQIICVSDYDRAMALRLRIGASDDIATVRYGIPDIATPGTVIPQQAIPRFLMVARFNEQKDHETLLYAINLLKDIQFEVQFAGSGPGLARCKQIVASLGLSSHVVFLGDRSDVPNLLTSADAFVLSTHYEGLPISILEAMRAGLPVIATSVSGIPEEIDDGISGLLTQPRDPKSIAAALRKLIENPDLRRAMGLAARRKYLQEFTAVRMYKEIIQIYDKARQK
jgi:glycosyltransferase involved in cell wall biosynthesis